MLYKKCLMEINYVHLPFTHPYLHCTLSEHDGSAKFTSLGSIPLNPYLTPPKSSAAELYGTTLGNT